ncbi:MAG TPA: cell division protein FtsL [Rubrivivax sp.]|nr:cell division protein FtsL [Pseudomonadota bacterium]MCW5639832.1 cell division protein FtsL [Rubrivivax sp.]HOW47229.1 cell division protein FtsL [Rubrivivax sp.]HRY88577.1 cell division protein FtsL [Rubrivivax sp.]HRZ61029.1 cell division protein FtsL [Rubrivivax sp.]
MTRLNLLLLAALLGSCLVLVRAAYDSRRLFTAIERARVEQARLDTEYRRLDAERQAQATHLRVEKTARERLRMRTATPAVTQFLEDPALAHAPAAAVEGEGTP